MKIFFDTNVLIAAFVSHGSCKELFEYCLASHSIYISDFVIKEFGDKLSMKFKFPERTVNDAVSFLHSNTYSVKATKLSGSVSRDPKDDFILAGTVEAGADCLVTGDKDLLILKQYQNIKILKPADFWKFEKENS